MILNWFDAKASKEFGAGLASFYIERIPVNTEFSEGKFAAKTVEVLKKMEVQIAQFKQQHKLNVYKVAQLGNAFKWTLKDAGYEDVYIDNLTDWLVTKI